MLPCAVGFFRESQVNGLDSFLVMVAGVCFETWPQDGAESPPMTGVAEFEPGAVMVADERLGERSDAWEEDVTERPRLSVGSSVSVMSFSTS